MRHDLPSGAVTFLFTDIEGSTKLLHELGAEGYAAALAEHRRALRETFARDGGVEVDTQGDAFFYAFPTAHGALAAAREGQERLAAGPIRVRIGIHTGTPHVTNEGYVGDDVHLGARIAASAHGGQVVCSKATAEGTELEVTDLGEHRLKDIEQPVAIFQLGEERFPPLKTISNTNLPRPASSFVGRERETAEVVELLRDSARLVTLSGPGGSGKTRLAIEAASALVSDFKSGTFWVGLAALRDAALVTETIAQTLGAKDGLGDHIGERELLLLLDNLEQVVDCAPALADLLESCPNLRLLATSRELLRVRGEVEYAVPPLTDTEAVALFCERSRLKADDTIAELCRRLDNLPLAVELAAARTRVLSPGQILERLSQRLDLLKGGRDAEARQQTLRATIAWSYELLSEDEQRLFARLSVFRGGCTLAAAEDVCDADLDTLQSLVEKSLVRFTNERYWLLETIREYAAGQLAESGERDAIRRRFADHLLTMAESLPVDVPVASGWLDRMDAEHDNLRAALDFLEDLGETQQGLRLAGALWRFWGVRGHHREGMERLGETLARDHSATAARAGALIGACAVAVDVKEYERARRYADEALDLYRGVEDAWGVARATFFQGFVAIESGDFARARPPFEECLKRFTELGAEHDVQLVLFNLSWACEELGDEQRARDLAEECLRRARASGSRRNLAFALDLVWGERLRDDGRLDEALEAAFEGLRIRRDEGDVQHQLDGLSRVASIYARADRAEEAATLLSSSVHLHEELGMLVPLYQEKRNKETLHILHEQLDEAAFAEACEHGETLTLAEAIALALEG
jgi:predicted ATPase